MALRHRQALQRTAEKVRAQRHDSIGHLGPEAIVAFVDGEMDDKSMHRVRVHLVHCPECRREVRQQRGAAEWVRSNDDDSQLHAPRDLMAKLAGIAADAPLSGPRAEDTTYECKRDFLDKVEMVYRAIKHNQRG